jgi:hypothetical protein
VIPNFPNDSKLFGYAGRLPPGHSVGFVIGFHVVMVMYVLRLQERWLKEFQAMDCEHEIFNV